ncbi:hypothetical protein [Candidatus Nanohalovita haloferacivicina]|uniref:hypothetical protein n=1 Tax=Candidatus Nanohalovita haloferacivicina TaxID=2978046 RepID=UPI00325FBC36|nr:hypothetical protein HBNXNv_0307 [Candidatus Nanohalobia archaeon BNXNv]
MEDRKQIEALLSEYRDANSVLEEAQFLKDKLVEALEEVPARTEAQKHNLNLLIRELEEELNWTENEKLAEFDPEQQ